MFGHRSFLVSGENEPADIVSLIKGGMKLLIANFHLNRVLTKTEKYKPR